MPRVRVLRAVCGLLAAVVVLAGFAGWRGQADAATTSARVFFLRDGKVAAAERRNLIQDVSIYDAALQELRRGPRPDERGAGLQTAVNDQIATVAPTTVDDATKVATVDFNAAFSDAQPAQLAQRMAQVVYTLTQFSDVRAVAFRVEGQPLQALNGDGAPVDGPVRRADYEALTPAIFVETPEVLTTVRTPIRVRGTANTFEATFQYALFDVRNRQLADGFVTATSGSGTRGRFSFEIPYELEAAGRGTLVVYEASAKDGTPINVVAIPLELRASVQPTATSAPTQTPTAAATATATATAAATQTATPRPTVAPVEPTATPVPPTATPVPPQPTATPLPPEPTATPAPAPTGTIGLNAFVCPPGMNATNLDAASCEPVVAGFDVRLTSRTSGERFTVADARRDFGSIQWDGLPFDDYDFALLAAPDGFRTDAFVLSGAPFTRGSAERGYVIALSKASRGFVEVRLYLFSMIEPR